MRPPSLMIAATALVGALVLAGCSAAARSDASDPLLVSAAASLADAFAEMALAFEASNPGTDVALNLGGSAALREQVLAGAPVDVLATASPQAMAPLVEAGATRGTPATFARNGMALIVPAGNPGGVTGLADLATPALFVGLCDPAVPCGGLADAVLAAAGVTPSIDTRERDVRSLLTKVVAGDLDAGLVYVTDALAAGDAVEAIAPDALPDLQTAYVIAPLTDAADPAGAAAFVEFTLSDDGQAIMRRHGFGAP